MAQFNNGPADGQPSQQPDNTQEFTYVDDEGRTICWLGDFTESEDDAVSLSALRDLLDAVYSRLATEGSPMVQLYAHSLAVALDEQMEAGR